jgi:hypothetical protein
MARTNRAQSRESAEDQLERLPLGAELEKHVRRRAGNRCQVPSCPFPANVDIHHIDGDRTHNSRGNLIALCPSHHRMAHKGQIAVWRLHWYNLRSPFVQFMKRVFPFATKGSANPAKRLLAGSSGRIWFTIAVLLLLTLMGCILLTFILRIRM